MLIIFLSLCPFLIWKYIVIKNTANFTLLNLRENSITIDSVNFSGTSFNTSTSFPVNINPLETGVIAIDCLPQNLGFILDSMVLSSSDLPDGVSVSLSAIGSEGNLLSGELPEILPRAIYRITGDINIVSGATLSLLPGTEFLFKASP